MKKQVLALSCALALGTGAAAWSPAGVQGVEPAPQAQPTGQIGFFLTRNQSAMSQAVAAGAGAAGAGKIGEVAGTAFAVAKVVPKVTAGMSVARAAFMGARIGAIGGFAGLVAGAAIGAA